MDDIDFKALEEELAKIDPAELRNLSQLLSENVPVVEKIIQNVLEEPISEETQKHLQPPLSPKPFQPIAPPRNRNRRQELLRRFDPFPPQNIRNVTDYQNEILNLYDVARFEGVVTSGGASSKIFMKTSPQNLWKKSERTCGHHFTPGTFTHISCATLKAARKLSTTPTKAPLG